MSTGKLMIIGFISCLWRGVFPRATTRTSIVAEMVFARAVGDRSGRRSKSS